MRYIEKKNYISRAVIHDELFVQGVDALKLRTCIAYADSFTLGIVHLFNRSRTRKDIRIFMHFNFTDVILAENSFKICLQFLLAFFVGNNRSMIDWHFPIWENCSSFDLNSFLERRVQSCFNHQSVTAD